MPAIALVMVQVTTPPESVVSEQTTGVPCGSVTVQVTVPAGVPVPGGLALTVAVKVKLAPVTGVEALFVITVLVLSVLTVTAGAPPEEPRKFELPL